MFDSLLISKFYAVLCTSMTLRAVTHELEKRAQCTEEELEVLKQAQEIVRGYLEEECSYLEKELDYQVVPIKDLVKIQLESGLIVSQNI